MAANSGEKGKRTNRQQEHKAESDVIELTDSSDEGGVSLSTVPFHYIHGSHILCYRLLHHESTIKQVRHPKRRSPVTIFR